MHYNPLPKPLNIFIIALLVSLLLNKDLATCCGLRTFVFADACLIGLAAIGVGGGAGAGGGGGGGGGFGFDLPIIN